MPLPWRRWSRDRRSRPPFRGRAGSKDLSRFEKRSARPEVRLVRCSTGTYEKARVEARVYSRRRGLVGPHGQTHDRGCPSADPAPK